ncbi:ABC transporter ATP-binding protein [Roseobacter weihaiensis]|uniref:ABC transporter ATP-binding protein n=1 Tax=Roseobacter weihaiensis TaxID=2763262 RepID=UPI001D0A4A2C|nr:ABC transporter ATP-binding protein [Roseobacter sp. H9]
MTHAMQVSNLTAGYGRRQVLHNVSLDIEEGQVVGIIGPNGHGKSTLLKVLSGLVPVTSGQVFMGGISMDGLSAHGRVEQGLVQIPQGDLVFPDMTVEENLFMGGYLAQGRSEIERRLERVYDLFPRLAERRPQIARTLSGGERRMLGIGRGLMSEGQVVLIDEPSLGLAPKVIDMVYDVLAKLRSVSPTLLIVEENPVRLQGIADHIYLMDNGEFVWNGTPGELSRNSDLIATYLGT